MANQTYESRGNAPTSDGGGAGWDGAADVSDYDVIGVDSPKVACDLP
jgi:hypothetical protein